MTAPEQVSTDSGWITDRAASKALDTAASASNPRDVTHSPANATRSISDDLAGFADVVGTAADTMM